MTYVPHEQQIDKSLRERHGLDDKPGFLERKLKLKGIKERTFECPYECPYCGAINSNLYDSDGTPLRIQKFCFVCGEDLYAK